jgi:Common central domain of tyrosinase
MTSTRLIRASLIHDLYHSALKSIQKGTTTSTYNLLMRVHTWPEFSNHIAGDGRITVSSLEAIHDNIHGYIAGQMGDPAVAGNFSLLWQVSG